MSGHILVVDPVPTNRATLKARLAEEYYNVRSADNASDAFNLAVSEQPDLILLNTELGEQDGFTLCRMFKSAPNTAHIPIILISEERGDDVVRGFDAGADDVLFRPINAVALKARLRNLIRMKLMLDELRLRDDTARDLGVSAAGELMLDQLASDAGILLVPHNARDASSWVRHISQTITVPPKLAWSEADTLDAASRGDISVCVIHRDFGANGDGLRLISQLRSREATRHLAIILVVENNDMETAARGLELGASDFITTPMNLSELAGRIRCQMRRKFVSDELRANLRNGMRAAVIDPLTKLYNRRYASQHLPRLMQRAQDIGEPFAVMMLDLDHFKQVNDTFGHLIGDIVLQETAQRLRLSIRNVDLLARFGGEEFFIAMPDASIQGAAQVAERVRAAIEEKPYRLPDGKTLKVTISIGVTMADPGDPGSIDAVLEQADRALYASKEAGRNCVRFHREAA